jgi:hypothetical protein
MLRLQLYNFKGFIASPFIRNLRLFHSIDSGASRTPDQLALEPPQFLRASLRKHLHPAVGKVPDVPLEAQGTRVSGYEPPKTDPLDLPRDEESQDHWARPARRRYHKV